MVKITKAYGRILVALLALLGFSCDERGKFEYGTPTATFKTKGVVVSQTDDTPIEGIRAVLKAQPDAARGIDTVYTDGKGVFNLKSPEYVSSMTLYVELADVDGEENGAFIDKDVEADFSNVKYTGGEAEKDLGIVKLEPK